MRYYIKKGVIILAVSDDGNSYSVATPDDPQWEGFVGTPWRMFNPAEFVEISEEEAMLFLELDGSR